MTRTVLILVCATAAGVAAAPVPAPSEKELIAKHWGKAEGEGAFELKDRRLTLRLAGENGSAELRVVRTVRGDFTAEVRVEADCPNPTMDDAQHPGTRAGVLVRGGESTLDLQLFQCYCRGADGQVQQEAQRSVAANTSCPGFGGVTQWGSDSGMRAVHLRVTRFGKAVSVHHSPDGKAWESAAMPEQLTFPDEVTVGVFLSQTTRQKLSATFEGFAVTAPKK